jgi:hypothetical protein
MPTMDAWLSVRSPTASSSAQRSASRHGHQHCTMNGVCCIVPAGIGGDVAAVASIVHTRSDAEAATLREGPHTVIRIDLLFCANC